MATITLAFRSCPSVDVRLSLRTQRYLGDLCGSSFCATAASAEQSRLGGAVDRGRLRDALPLI